MARLFKLLILTACFLLPAAASAQMGSGESEPEWGDKETLKTEIDNFRYILPLDLGASGSLTSVDYDAGRDFIIFDFEINPTIVDLDYMRSHPDYKKIKGELSVLQVLQGYPQFGELGVGMEYNYIHPVDGERVTIIIPASRMKELKEMGATKEEVGRKMIELAVADDNRTLPNMPGLEGSYAELVDNVYRVVYMIQDNTGMIETVRSHLDEQKQALRDAFASQLTMQTLAGSAADAGISLAFRYTDSKTGDFVETTFTPEELNSMRLNF